MPSKLPEIESLSIEVPKAVFEMKREPVTRVISDLTQRARHQHLLTEKRELVLPHHYKGLLDLQQCLDVSLNFIKQCRGGGTLGFEELKASVEKTYGRRFDIPAF